MGLFVLISLVLYLLPERWMAEYGKAMTLSTETGLIPALAMVVGAPLAEELVFRGIIQSRLERSLPAWIAVVLQAVLFGLIHGTPVQIGYAFIMGLLFGLLRWRTGSILPTLAAHAAFNAMNDPLGLLGDFAESWYFLVVIIAVSAAGCVLCRRIRAYGISSIWDKTYIANRQRDGPKQRCLLVMNSPYHISIFKGNIDECPPTHSHCRCFQHLILPIKSSITRTPEPI